jgi:hypothetical protein
VHHGGALKVGRGIIAAGGKILMDDVLVRFALFPIRSHSFPCRLYLVSSRQVVSQSCVEKRRRGLTRQYPVSLPDPFVVGSTVCLKPKSFEIF